MQNKTSTHEHSSCTCTCTHTHTHQHRHSIYIYSPSGAVRQRHEFRRGVRRLEALGCSVEIDPSALARHERFAGTDQERLEAIHRAAASKAEIALMARGGYGFSRLLAHIDYELVSAAIASGTEFVGMSDFTALQMALLAKTGARTWAGGLLCADFGRKDSMDEITQACFEDLLLSQGEGAGWRVPKKGYIEQELEIENALLWGGNLAVLCSLIGTPYFPQSSQIGGGILFLEDVGEHPYRVERMLIHLFHAGVLQRQRAILMGQFSEYRLSSHDAGYRLESAVQWLREQQGMPPIVMGLPFGHEATKVMLPVGARVDLHVQNRQALLYWGHL